MDCGLLLPPRLSYFKHVRREGLPQPCKGHSCLFLSSLRGALCGPGAPPWSKETLVALAASVVPLGWEVVTWPPIVWAQVLCLSCRAPVGSHFLPIILLEKPLVELLCDRLPHCPRGGL